MYSLCNLFSTKKQNLATYKFLCQNLKLKFLGNKIVNLTTKIPQFHNCSQNTKSIWPKCQPKFHNSVNNYIIINYLSRQWGFGNM